MYQIMRLLVLIVPLSVSHVFADEHYDEIQRQDIALIQQQLRQVEFVLQRLEKRQNTIKSSRQGTRSIFLDITQFRSDLDTMQRGLDSYLSPGRPLPRNMDVIDEDLIGSYTKRVSR